MSDTKYYFASDGNYIVAFTDPYTRREFIYDMDPRTWYCVKAHMKLYRKLHERRCKLFYNYITSTPETIHVLPIGIMK